MSTMLRTQFEDLWFERLPLIDHVIFMKYSAYPEEFSRYFNMNTSNTAFVNVTGVTSLDYLAVKEEGQTLSYDNLLQAYDSKYTHVTYALGFRVSFEAIQDDLDGIMKRGGQALGVSARYTPELIAADVFNSGTTTATTNPNGEALFETDHALRGGGTHGNLVTGADLSVTALQNVLNLFAAQVDERGKKLNIRPSHMVVTQSDSWTASQLLGSTGLPGTADNDINSLRDAGLSWSKWHYLTDPDAYFVLADKSETELNFYWRQQFNTDHDIDFDTKDGKTSILGRFSVGWSDWRGVFASTGLD